MTGFPWSEGFMEDCKVVALAARATTIESTGDVLPLASLLPAYVAVMLC